MRIFGTLLHAIRISRLVSCSSTQRSCSSSVFSTFPHRPCLNSTPVLKSCIIYRSFGSKSGNSKLFNRKFGRSSRRPYDKSKTGERPATESADALPVAMIKHNSHNPSSLKILLIPVNIFEGGDEAIQKTLSMLSVVRNNASQIEAYTEKLPNFTYPKPVSETLTHNDNDIDNETIHTSLCSKFKSTDQQENDTVAIYKDFNKTFADRNENYQQLYDSFAYDTLNKSKENDLSPISPTIEERLLQLAMYSMQLEMDMTNARDDAIYEPEEFTSFEDPASTLTPCLDTIPSPHTRKVSLKFNALIEGIVEIDTSKVTPDHLKEIKVPEFNDYVTALAANICSTALQKGFPAEISRKSFSTKSGVTSNDSKKRSPHIVCVREGDKGCTSPGLADNSKFVASGSPPSGSSGSQKTTSKQKKSECGGDNEDSSGLQEDCYKRGLMSCKAYAQALEEADKRRAALKKADKGSKDDCKPCSPASKTPSESQTKCASETGDPCKKKTTDKKPDQKKDPPKPEKKKPKIECAGAKAMDSNKKPTVDGVAAKKKVSCKEETMDKNQKNFPEECFIREKTFACRKSTPVGKMKDPCKPDQSADAKDSCKDPCKSEKKPSKSNDSCKSEQSKKDPCKTEKKMDSCKSEKKASKSSDSRQSGQSKADSCKAEQKKDTCKSAQSKSGKKDFCKASESSAPCYSGKNKADPAKAEKKQDTCKSTQSKSDKKDPCKASKSSDSCKSGQNKPDPCKAEQIKDTCKSAQSKSEKKDPCKASKSSDSCKSGQGKPDPCKAEQKKDTCKSAQSKSEKKDPCKASKSSDSCKSGQNKPDPCKPEQKKDTCKSAQSKSEKKDPCKASKSSDSCKSGQGKPDPCKAKQEKDTCKSAQSKSEKKDPCKASKSSDSCKSGQGKPDPCKAKQEKDTCKSAQSKSEKKDPCKASKSSDSCKSGQGKQDPCKAKQEKVTCKSAQSKLEKKDPCKASKSSDSCKSGQGKPDPCKAKQEKDTCKSAQSKSEKKDPCKASKSSDSCKSGQSKKDPCKAEQKKDTCKSAQSKTEKTDSCKAKEKDEKCKDPCKSAKSNSGNKNPCQAEQKSDPCKPEKQSSECESEAKKDTCKSSQQKDSSKCSSKRAKSKTSLRTQPTEKPGSASASNTCPTYSPASKIKDSEKSKSSSTANKSADTKKEAGSCAESKAKDTKAAAGKSSSKASKGKEKTSYNMEKSTVCPSHGERKSTKPNCPSNKGNKDPGKKSFSTTSFASTHNGIIKRNLSTGAFTVLVKYMGSVTSGYSRFFSSKKDKDEKKSASPKCKGTKGPKKRFTIRRPDTVKNPGVCYSDSSDQCSSEKRCDPKLAQVKDKRCPKLRPTCVQKPPDPKDDACKDHKKENKSLYKTKFIPNTKPTNITPYSNMPIRNFRTSAESSLQEDRKNNEECDLKESGKNEEKELTNEVIKVVDASRIEIFSGVIPRFSDYDVLVRMDCVAISGSDLHVYETGGNAAPGITLGHDASGIVEKVGKCVQNLKPRDRVAIESGLSCGICEFCKRGAYNICSHLIHNGFFGKFQVHPADLCHKLPASVSLENGCLAQILATGCHACSKARIKPTSNVIIIGSSPTAIAAALCVRAIGASRICFLCTHECNLEVIRTQFNFDYVIYDSEMEIIEVVECIYCFLREWPDVIINCAVNEVTLNIAVMSLATNGTCVMAECESECASFNVMETLMKNLKLIPSFRSTNMFPTALLLMENGQAAMQELIVKSYPWDQVHSAFVSALHHSNVSNKKVIVKCGDENVNDNET